VSARIADEAGHLWPRTGRQCPTCRMPTSHGDVHPGCAALPTAQPGPDAAVDLLHHTMGATTTAPPSDRWRASGEPVAILRDIPSRDHTRCVDCDKPLPTLAIAAAVIRHVKCWSTPPEDR
jgi:hypothetical protein